jgi:hypothetical protein
LIVVFVFIKNHQPTPLLPPTTHSPSPQPTIRPMYPSPASAYRPPAVVQQPQFIPQTTYPQMANQNSQPPPPPSSSTYPYTQYNNNLNTTATANNVPQSTSTYPGHPGQPPPFPQPMPYAMGGTTAGAANQQMNNINGPLPVSIIVDK